MKILRYISYSLIFLILIILIIGNIFYRNIRKMIDKNYKVFDVDQKVLTRYYKNKNQDYEFYLFTDKYEYNKFEKVCVIARIVNKKDDSIPDSAVINVEFYRNNEKVYDIGKKDKIKLIYQDKQKLWVGIWIPVDVNLEGNIEIKAYGYLDTPQEILVAQNNFYVKNNISDYSLPKGMTFIGIDSMERIMKRSILSIDGKEVDWNYLPEWINFIFADGIFMLGGLTKTFSEDVNIDYPWDRDKLNETVVLAEKINQKGKSFGVWVKGLKVEGIYAKKMGYELTYNLNNGNMEEDNITISLNDLNRKKNIEKIYLYLLDNYNINYIGFSDLIIPKYAGLELYEKYINDIQLDIPDNWTNMDFDERLKYFVNKMNNSYLFDNFLKWKEYYNVEYIKDIISVSPKRKPLFYIINYKDLLENPVYLSMILNAGFDFVVIDFKVDYYNINNELEKLKKISDFMKYYNRIIISYYIDYQQLEIDNFQLSAIENYVTANMNLIKNGSIYLNANGIMINDFYKAMFGKRGPYSPYDWLMGISETIYQANNIFKEYPIKIEIKIPDKIYYGDIIIAKIRIINDSIRNVNNLKINFIPSYFVNEVRLTDAPSSLSIPTFQAGKEDFIDVQIQFKTQNSQFIKKKNIFGVRVSWDELDKTKNGYIRYFPIIIEEKYISTNTNI